MAELQELGTEKTEAAKPPAVDARPAAQSQDQGLRGDLLSLQRSVGNRAVVDLLRAGQAKLVVGAANDS